MRTREDMWDWTWNARKFMLQNLPFESMEPADQLLTGETLFHGGAEVFALPGVVYAAYLPSTAATGRLLLPGGTYKQRWYDPRTGQFAGTQKLVTGGGQVPLGAPPSLVSEDWVVLFQHVTLKYDLSFKELEPGLPDSHNSASMDGATPGGPVLVFYSLDGTGLFPLPGCSGVYYDLVNSQYGFTVQADAAGSAQFSLYIGAGPPPGTTVYLQALDPMACAVSNVTSFTW
jgi:hypothetical protein